MQTLSWNLRAFNKYWSWLFVLCTILLGIAGCSLGSTASSSNSTPTPPPIDGEYLGTLPNNATVYINQSSFSVNSGESTTGTLSIYGGTANTSYAFSFGLTPATNPAPNAITNPNPCILTSGSVTTSCQVILNSESAANGTYTVTVFYSQTTLNSIATAQQSQASESLPIKFSFTVSGNTPPVTLGALSIAPLLESTGIESNGASYALISRSGSLASPITISVQSTTLSLGVSPESIILNANESSGYVRLTGLTTGPATLTVSANNYTESQVTYIITTAPLFSCVADISNPASPNLCGCLNENDGTGLTWYRDGSQTGSWTDWCTESLDGSCSSDGASIVAFNAESICGYSDWHLPTAPDALGAPYASDMGGNWGAIGNYALDNGYTNGYDLAYWLNSNGFSGVTDNIYWSSASYDSSLGWGVFMPYGYTVGDSVSYTNRVLVVRGSQ